MGQQFTVGAPPVDRTVPEDTAVQAKLVDLKTDTVNYQKNGEPRSFEKMTWWFEVTQPGSYEGRKIKGELTGNDAEFFSDGVRVSRANTWAETLLGRQLPQGLVVDVDDLLDLPCSITVRHEPDRRDSHKIWERVDEVLPAEGSSFTVSEPPF